MNSSEHQPTQFGFLADIYIHVVIVGDRSNMNSHTQIKKRILAGDARRYGKASRSLTFHQQGFGFQSAGIAAGGGAEGLQRDYSRREMTEVHLRKIWKQMPRLLQTESETGYLTRKIENTRQISVRDPDGSPTKNALECCHPSI